MKSCASFVLRASFVVATLLSAGCLNQHGELLPDGGSPDRSVASLDAMIDSVDSSVDSVESSVDVVGRDAGSDVADAGDAPADCQGGATQCVGAKIQVCTAGQWGPATDCAARQSCTGSAGTAKCTCAVDPVCKAPSKTCMNTSTVATCIQDGNGCLYQAAPMTCGMHETCVGSACMCVADPLCPAAGTFCASSFTLATCSVDSGCFYQPALPATCAINTVCERVAPASCADPSWAEWPVPPAASPSAYSDNKDGTITDNITGLMWQSPPAATAMTQSAAIIYCSTMLTLAGHSDWRLPTRIELLSLVDLGRTATPAINPIFTNTLSEIYWTSTTYALAASYSWAVNFTFGHGVPHHDDITNTGAVRCVR